MSATEKRNIFSGARAGATGSARAHSASFLGFMGFCASRGFAGHEASGATSTGFHEVHDKVQMRIGKDTQTKARAWLQKRLEASLDENRGKMDGNGVCRACWQVPFGASRQGTRCALSAIDPLTCPAVHGARTLHHRIHGHHRRGRTTVGTLSIPSIRSPTSRPQTMNRQATAIPSNRRRIFGDPFGLRSHRERSTFGSWIVDEERFFFFHPQSTILDLRSLSGSSAVAPLPPIFGPPSNASKNKVASWKRPRSKPWRPRRKPAATACDEPGFLAAQVFAVAAETGWPEERILFMPLARLAQYQHCLLRRNGVRTHWSATREGGTSLREQLEALRLQWNRVDDFSGTQEVT